MAVKRSRGEEGDVEMANCLMLLSNSGDQEESTSTSTNSCNSAGRLFECKTCNRQFPSFQALGGHRASHKRARVGASEEAQERATVQPKTHECPICGTEFAMGQALGGHMRRHRAELKTLNDNVVHQPHHLSLDLNLLPLDHAHQSIHKKSLPALNSGTKRIGGFQLSEKNSGRGGLDSEFGIFLGLGMVGKFPLVH